MSTDYASKEREFLASLEADTGRDLAGWMAAITGAGLADRNAIIDWLRRQGFLFDRASWLERIHHNGGRPIYADKPPEAAAAGPVRPPVPAAPAPRTPQPPGAGTPMREAPPREPSSAPARPGTGVTAPHIAELLAKGKAFRLLAEHLLRETGRRVGGLEVGTDGSLVTLGAPHPFAVLQVSPRDVRLGLDPGGREAMAPFRAGRLAGAEARFSHVVVLTDARQVDQALLDRLAEAAAGAAA